MKITKTSLSKKKEEIQLDKLASGSPFWSAKCGLCIFSRHDPDGGFTAINLSNGVFYRLTKDYLVFDATDHVELLWDEEFVSKL